MDVERNAAALSAATADSDDRDDACLKWYLGLHSRVLDLVGDYAGNERFLIEGDSLLRHCLEDSRIDFEDGFQLLHAAYEVERFLESLVRRLCNFHIVFFDANEHLCVPLPDSPHQNFYLLTRAIILRHLRSNLPETHPNIEIHHFSSIYDPTFGEYLESSGVYFIMCHDGATQTQSESQVPNNKSTKVAFRKMIRRFILPGFSVALINGLEVRDTKVMAMIVEGRGGNRTSISTISPVDTRRLPPERCYTEICSSQFTERLNLTLLALEKLLTAEPKRAPLVSAFLLHAVLLGHIPLSHRRMREIELTEESALRYRKFLDDFATTALWEISHSGWDQPFDERGDQCDVADLVDGRLFKVVLFAIQGQSDARTLLPEQVVQEFIPLAATLEKRCGVRLVPTRKCDLSGKAIVPTLEKSAIPPVLSFSHTVFDLHLASIQINVGVLDSPTLGARSFRIFREISHWHNSKRPIDKIQAGRIYNDKARQRLLRSQQRYMGEMLKYAASLTNASGKILDPQTITVRKDTKSSASAINANAKKPDVPADTKKGKQGAKKPVSGARELAQASINSKRDVYAEKTFSSWANMREIFDRILDPEARYQRTKTYFQDLPADKLKILKAEITLYSLQPLLEIWAGFCRSNKEDGYKIAALIWDHIQGLWKSEHGLTKTVTTCVLGVCRLLGFPTDRETPATAVDRPLTFAFKTPPASSYTLSVDLPPREFQLLHCGPYMDRNMDSHPDPRVPFNPDGWQREVLDELDANHSVFVVAPTSAGKTFISFYAMEKVLRADDDAVLVYVAPTKALVNQIGAEIQARFSKTYKHGGKSVWAIHTRDYRVNNPTGCQVLVTLPAILQIMLLAPSNARSWAPRVKRIIFDEIHSIGQAEDGVIWEQLLLLAPCPIIALSATVGNPEQFNDWLASTQRSSKFILTMIQHQHRYSDLRKFVYNPPKRFALAGLGKRSTLGDMGLDGISSFQFFHPVASLVNKSRGIPADLSLEPRDCLILWKTMAKHQTTDYPLPESLDPKTSCPPTIAKADVIAWERALKKILSAWMSDPNSPFYTVLHDLLNPLEKLATEALATSADTNSTDLINPYDLCATALPLVVDLHERGALPAILFNYDRSSCEHIAQSILQGLESAEHSWKETSPRWKSLIEGYGKWKAAKKKEPTRTAAKSKRKGGKDADADGERLSKTDMERESGDREGSQYETFDPDAPCEEFSFADKQKVEVAEIEGYFNKLAWHGVPEWLLTALTRGIGVHHAGMNRKYRQTIEILFRKGYLKVVIATGTLALGINMPCKTVVFSGDSVFLTALNFRQGAGRAGRRGFDILGNVVFHGIHLDKACRLLSSRLPDLNGHFPMTTTLVLRLFALLHESKESEYARRAVNALLSQPRLYLGGESFKDQVLHHVRFSIEYLRRQRLLGPRGEPINFTSCVTHLFFTENSSFAFHALLKAGYFHDLCAGIHEKPQAVLRQLMLVMSHLFGRRPCRQSDSEFVEEIVKRSPSIVFLPELPKKAVKVLRQHNKETLETFTTYVKTFAKQHIKDDDRTLPLTGLQLGGITPVDALKPLQATTARSHFVALSGHSDTFTSITDLCHSTRSGIFLEKAVIPQLDIQQNVPLNAYLYDYFMHGAVEPLEIANRIRKGDIWFLLNDFSLVLATIVTSLTNFLKLDQMEDGDMANLAGQGDVMEEDAEVKAEEASEGPSGKPPPQLTRGDTLVPGPKPQKKKKQAVPDTWEGEEDTIANEEEAIAAADEESWDGDTGGSDASATEDGLLNVLHTFKMLKEEFDEKFKAMWA